jgi:hypothetical protein
MNAAIDMKAARCEFNRTYHPFAQKIAYELGLGKVDRVRYSYGGTTVSFDCDGLQIAVRGEMTMEAYKEGKSYDEFCEYEIEKALRQYKLLKSGLPEQGQRDTNLKKDGLNFLQRVRNAGNKIWQ